MPRILKYSIVGLAVTLFVIFAISSRGQNMYSPGRLDGEHLEHLSKCTACHLAFRGTPDAKCLGCHRKVAREEKEKQGLHGGVTGDCLRCHRLHRNNGPITAKRFEKGSFDHNLTPFALRKHRKQACSACHRRKFKRMNVKTCLKCHRRGKRAKRFAGHVASLGTKCLNCHDGRSRAKFKHTGAVGFFTGKHIEKKCARCHKKNTYTAISSSCDNCHLNPHAKTTSPCQSCHFITGWKQVSFNHKEKACKGCHNAPNNHFSGNCGDCHNTKNWKKTKFKHPRLRGEAGEEHSWRSYPCRSCHPDNYKTYSCLKCHDSNDPDD